MLDESTTALNVTVPRHTVGIFKPHALRLTPEPKIISDADAEIIVIARFSSPVHVRKIIIIGGGENYQHPSFVKCYVNQENVDFNNIEELNPVQQFTLPVNEEGSIELTTVIHSFTNVNVLSLYFPSNHGEQDTTVIQYIGLQGEHTHYRREAVDTVYEVLCNGQDIIQPEDAAGISKHMH
jgi:hypothetical protein